MTSNSPQVVITGVASGIGKETAQLMSSQGYHVIGVDRAPVEEFEGTFIQGDLSDTAGITAMADNIPKVAPEGIQGVANVAGVPGRAPVGVGAGVNGFGGRGVVRGLPA